MIEQTYFQPVYRTEQPCGIAYMDSYLSPQGCRTEDQTTNGANTQSHHAKPKLDGISTTLSDSHQTFIQKQQGKRTISPISSYLQPEERMYLHLSDSKVDLGVFNPEFP